MKTLIAVRGGIAEVVFSTDEQEVEIIDFDTLGDYSRRLLEAQLEMWVADIANLQWQPYEDKAAFAAELIAECVKHIEAKERRRVGLDAEGPTEWVKPDTELHPSNGNGKAPS